MNLRQAEQTDVIKCPLQEKPMKVFVTAVAALLMTCAILPAQDDLTASNDSLRAAVEGKKGAAEIKRLAVQVMTQAKKQMGPVPAGMEKDSWEEHAKYAEQVSEYAEYALYAASVGAPAATAIDMVSTLETQNPKSKYLTQDAYITVANAAMSSQMADRATAFAKKSLTAPKGAKPEQATATAHYIVGVVAATKNDFATADKELKAALPGIKGIPAMEGPAYYYLGAAEYRLGRQAMDRAQIDQGIKYTGQAALISGQYQQLAAAGLKTMKTEMGIK
jgi:hypothetical protein